MEQWLVLSPLPGSNPCQKGSQWSLHVWLPKIRLARLIVDSKLPIGWSLSIAGCLSLHASPVSGLPCLSPSDSWMHPKTVCAVQYREWMDG